MMRKKLILLLAGILLIGANAFAKGEESTKWDFKDSNVEWKSTLYSSETEETKFGKDLDLILKLKKQLDENTSIYLKYDTDDGDGHDDKAEFVAKRKINKFLYLQVDLDVKTSDGFDIIEDDDSSKTKIVFKATDDVELTFNPLEIDLGTGDEFETDNTQVTPGLQAKVKLIEGVTANFGLGTKSVLNKDGKDVSSWGYKLGLAIEKDNFGFEGIYTSNTQDTGRSADDELAKLRDEDYSEVKTVAGLMGNASFGELSLTTEILMTQLNKAKIKNINDDGTLNYYEDDNGLAIFFKAKYNLGAIANGVVAKPYLEYRNVDEYAYFDDDDSQAFGEDQHGGLQVIEVGTEFKIRKFIIQPYIEILKSDNKFYTDRDGKVKDTASSFVIESKIKF